MGDRTYVAGLPAPAQLAAAVPAPRGYVWLSSRLARPRAVLWLSLAAFALSLPAMATGLVTDDYALEVSVLHDPWNAFAFQSPESATVPDSLRAQRDIGRLPWWVDKQLRLAFMRPLTSLTHAVDFRLWPRAVFLMHAENSLLFALAVWLAGMIYRELGLSGVTVGLATLFYAASGSHAIGVGWLSARNTVLAAVFGLLALWLHLRSEREGTAPGRALASKLTAAAALGCGLLSAEFACGVAGFLLADALILRAGPLPRRLLSLWPYAIVLAAWQAVYIARGYGVTASGFYHGPAQAPGAFALGVATGLPIYVASQLTVPFATLASFFPWSLAVLTAISVAMLFALRDLFSPLLRRERCARFLAIGTALATVPLGATVTQSRLVFFVALGAAAVIAWVVTQRLEPTNHTLPRRGAEWLFRVHGIYLPILFVPTLFSVATANAVGGGVRALARALPESGERGVVLLNAPSEVPSYFQSYIRTRAGKPKLPYLYLLYAGPQSIDVRRSSERSLDVGVRAGYLSAPIEQLVRDPRRSPFHSGDVVELPHMKITTVNVNAGGAPTRVRFEFPDQLERVATDWLVWEAEGPRPWTPPPVGGHVALAALRAAL